MPHPISSLTRLGILFGVFLFAAPEANADADYLRGVKPILAARCYACHGALKQKSGLRLDTVDLMKKGGDAGPAIVSGNSAKSILIDHVAGRNNADRMPPESEGELLKPAEITLFKLWIDEGANGPADEKPELDPKDHWAFKVPVRPALSKPGNPIDALLAVEWEKRGLKPQPPAERTLLLRRVYLDLIGLPPTRAEIAEFEKDSAANPQAAYEKVVDRLLASKHYGERWGRHWMDIWRYSDWWGLGAEVRNSQKHIWHWRDWIVDSLNADKGYDQMLREMLAADELYPTDADKLRGSGFLARQYFKFNRNTWLEEVVEHTSKAFLGLTMNCSKCHDHKYDPLSQQDFYKFRAFFEPYQVRTDMVLGQTDFEKDGLPRAFDCNLNVPTYLFVRGDEKNPRKDLPIAPGFPSILSFDQLTIKPVALPIEAYAPGLRSSIIEHHRKSAESQIKTAKVGLELAQKAMADAVIEDAKKQTQARLAVALAEKALATAKLLTPLVEARVAADKARYQQPPAEDAKVLAQTAARLERGHAVAATEEAIAKAELELQQTAADKKAPVEKKLATARAALVKAQTDAKAPGETYVTLRGSLKTLENNLESEASRNKPFPTTSTGRRTALAAWMTDARHPLTARVAVNHIWARHFGKPLVASVFDFGRKGALPTHPEILDYLAVELRESDWSMKKIHRLIVTSNAYRMTSSSAGAATETVTADGENRYFWRMNPLRLESQIIRDSLLALSGQIDPTIGGPSIPAADEAAKRRSLYFVHSHNEHNRFLSIFDDANVLECYRRAESIVPQQALALENSKLVFQAAENIARRIDEKENAAFIKTAYLMVLGTTPTTEELAACEEAMNELRTAAPQDKKTDGALRARINLVHALLNHHDFVTVR